MQLWSADKAGIFLLIIAAVGWCIAAPAASDALSSGKSSSGRAALGYWMPTLLVVIAAIVRGNAEIVVSVIFGASVAALTLVLGIVTISSSDTRPTSPRGMWAFVLPTALICLLIGFSSAINWFDACVLVLEGLVLATLWNDRAEKNETIKLSSLHWLLLIAAIAASVVATLAALRGIHEVGNTLSIGDGLVTQALLGPMLVLPMIGGAAAAASRGRYDQAVTTAVGYVLLNLCLLLPLAAVFWMGRSYWMQMPTTQPTTMPVDAMANVLPYPLGVWRVDTVLLAALGLLLLPVALGKWTLGKAEGFAMLFVYAIYVVLSAVMAR
jgi:Ca2+/Na+ antiporter